ncbi:MAG: hypothetical protein M1829_001866 [Trizodia sp. TS-e1964]|nr:MAG: hypothetical protein M1829_001866 [Trizodia sp. TS-e1964]
MLSKSPSPLPKRPASFTYLPSIKDLLGDDAATVTLRPALSETNLALSAEGEDYRSSFEISWPSNNALLESSTQALSISPLQPSSPKPKITISKFSPSLHPESGETSYFSKTAAKHTRPGKLDAKSRSVSESFASFARKSWISTSRPSSSGRDEESLAEEADADSFSPQPSRGPLTPSGQSQILQSSSDTAVALGRNGTGKTRKSKGPLGSLMKSSPETSSHGRQVVSQLRRSFSSDRAHSLSRSNSHDQMSYVPRNSKPDRFYHFKQDSLPKRDELWSAFRGLENEFQRFQSKSSTSKPSVVRSALLPFLRTHAAHRSNQHLRPEDLDRRINIFNKWWHGLLEILDAQNSQTISATDRPIILEAITAIMQRQEWRLSPSPFAPLSFRPPRAKLESESSSSLESTESGFFAESVYHNVRNLFVQNLLAQLAFVVDKMSCRTASASFVMFSGKAIAYAFFFCPGVADVLVDLWNIPPSLLKRIAAEHGTYGNSNTLDISSKEIIQRFPQCLHSLGYSSFPAMVKMLRKRPDLPLGAADIPWRGTWLARWSGADSDLFFIFTKYYHILAADFLPIEATNTQRCCSPGFILVHAQLLKNLDSTIHRHAANSPRDLPPGPTASTFDDVLLVADASLIPLPLPATNASRVMSENRIIMLLREFLSESSEEFENARRAFAESIDSLLKAGTHKTSLFDHVACFTLCDFLEEAIVILMRYKRIGTSFAELVDWNFWLDVCKRMTESENSMTDIRLMSFLYTIWGTITTDKKRKSALCLDWLLSESNFERLFAHWCPMVRAYYMRLLCWRLARHDRDASDVDVKILEVLAERLWSAWLVFLELNETAEAHRTALPSTAPCNPAPGRKLLIIKNDDPSGRGSMLLSFEGILPPISSAQSRAFRRDSALPPLPVLPSHPPLSEINSLKTPPSDVEIPDSNAPAESTTRKKWGLFRNMIPFANTATDSPPLANLPERKDSPPFKENGGQPVAEGTRENVKTRSSKQTNEFRSFSFKFSLEWVGDKASPGSKERRLYPPRLPMPAQMFLQLRSSDPEADSQNSAAKRSSTQPLKYVGKALAEWSLVVMECQSFFERRRNEGVPTNQFVETPSLGVDTFRRAS